MSTSQNEITKTIKSRIYLKHDISSNWDKANNFRPKKGEIIIYDPEGTQTRPRIKIGDDATLVKDLKFIDEKFESDINIILENIEDINKDIDGWKESLQNTENSIDGKITTAIANLLADTGEAEKIDTIKEILDWISGIDPDSSAIEIFNQVETNKDNIQNLSNQHSNFQTRIKEAEDKIELNTKTNQDQAEALLTQAGLINELENQHTEINERILGLQKDDNEINQHLEDIDGSINTIDNSINIIDSDIKDIKGNITILEDSLTKKINEDIKTTKDGINKDLVDLEDRLNDNLEKEVQTIDVTITNIETDITNMKQKDDEFSSTIGDLNVAVQTINNNITTLTNEDTNINQKINSLENKDKALEANINDIYDVKLPGLINTINELNENLVVASFDATKNTLQIIPEIIQEKGKLQQVGLEDYIEISLEDKDTTYAAGTGLELTEENVFNHINSITAKNNFNHLYLPSENGKVDLLINDLLYDDTGHIADYRESEITIPGAGKGLTYNQDDKTYDHTNKIDEKTTYNQSSDSPGYGGTFKITEPCFDEHGHITEFRVATITMPPAQEIPTSFNIEANGSGDGIVNLSLTGGANSISGQVSHKQYLNNSNSSSTNSDIGSNGGTLHIPHLSVDKYGHISYFGEQEIQITMPTYPGLNQNETSETVNITPNSSKQVNFTAISSLSVSNHQITDNETTYTLDLSDFALSDEVASAISSAMVFKGTLGTNGTITSLPTASINTEGDSYKVITAGTYNNENASVGDMFVCCKPVGSNDYDWVLIPSGDDEYKGTITSITAGTGLTGDTITTSGTISHATTSRNDTISAEDVKLGENFAVIDSVSTNNLGHVTSINTKTITLPSCDVDNTSTINIVGITDNGLKYKTNAKLSSDGEISAKKLTIDNIVLDGSSIDISDPNGIWSFHASPDMGIQNSITDSGNFSLVGGLLTLENNTNENTVLNGEEITITCEGETHKSRLTCDRLEIRYDDGCEAVISGSGDIDLVSQHGHSWIGHHIAYNGRLGDVYSGAFVTTEDENNGNANQPIYLTNYGEVNTCNQYAGGTKLTVNNIDKGATSVSIYAPTTSGTSGQVLKSNGSGAPVWVDGASLVSPTKVSFTATNGQTSFTIPFAYDKLSSNLTVYFNGILLKETDNYTVSTDNDTITLAGFSAENGDIITIMGILGALGIDFSQEAINAINEIEAKVSSAKAEIDTKVRNGKAEIDAKVSEANLTIDRKVSEGVEIIDTKIAEMEVFVDQLPDDVSKLMSKNTNNVLDSGYKITLTNVTPSAAGDVTTKQYVDNAISTATSNIVTDVFHRGTSAPSNTKLLWIDTSTNNGNGLMKYYNGSSWVAISAIWS